MNILVINAGSSSLKYQVIEMPSKEVRCSGNIERIGMDDAIFTHKRNEGKYSEVLAIENHSEAMQKITKTLVDRTLGVINHVDDIAAVGHRVVHGGRRFSNTVVVNDEVKTHIRGLFNLAPLHNPPNLTGIEIADTIFPKAKQVAVFDTAFHQTMPKVAYQYAIPKHFLEEHRIRAYGFHGTSHKYVSEKAAEYLGTENAKNMITIHLGNGCSMSAIKNGKSIDNSLGLGPMNGLVMGTRSGDIDQSVVLFLIKQLKMSADEVNNLLQKESGLKGLTGYSDLREISEQAVQGNENCIHGLKLVAYRIKKYIGSYAAILNGLDAIVFTAGIGENSSIMRKLACEDLDFLGVNLDMDKNIMHSDKIREIQSAQSKVKVMVIPTNEEIEIAKQTYQILNA